MNAPGAVLAAGLAALAVAAAVDLIGGARWPRVRAVPYLAGAAGAGCLAVAGAAAVAGHQARLGTGGWLGAGTTGLAADRLSGLFLVIALGAAVPVSLACASWAARPGTVGRRGLGAGYALTLGAVAMVMTATDAFTLLLAWELLTVAFYLLAGFERRRPGRPGAASSRWSSARSAGQRCWSACCCWRSGPARWSWPRSRGWRGGVASDTAQTLLIGGFAVKVGLIPVQVWMPRGYAAAPGPVRAIMAGVAVNVGFYGLWRTLALLGAPPAWLVGLLLVLAGLTALLGIAHAAVQPRLQRVIAYSSVENSGLILAGYGVALTGAATRDAPAGRRRPARRDAADHRAHGRQVTAVHQQRGHRPGRNRAPDGRQPGPAARLGATAAVERDRAGHRLADPGRAAADGRVRRRMVPAGSADAAVPGARARLPAGAGGGRGGDRADGRFCRCHVRPADGACGARAAARGRPGASLAERARSRGARSGEPGAARSGTTAGWAAPRS